MKYSVLTKEQAIARLELQAQIEHEYRNDMVRITDKILGNEPLTDTEQVIFCEYMDERL